MRYFRCRPTTMGCLRNFFLSKRKVFLSKNGSGKHAKKVRQYKNAEYEKVVHKWRYAILVNFWTPSHHCTKKCTTKALALSSKKTLTPPSKAVTSFMDHFTDKGCCKIKHCSQCEKIQTLPWQIQHPLL